MRTKRELLELLKVECEKLLAKDKGEWQETDFWFGICAVFSDLYHYNGITIDECYLLEEILEKNWHLAKYPERIFKFDTKAERIEFLDKLIEKYA